MEERTVRALHWIVNILNENNIPYRVGGGVAAYVYGSTRPIKDIDISLSGKFFPTIIANLSGYKFSGPKHHTDSKWDCNYLSIDYEGQEIDISDIDTLRMSNKERTGWITTKDTYRKFETRIIEIGGVNVSVIDPRDLVAYKKELDGDHQSVDIAAIQKYIHEER